jgi:hypothetical protein
MASPNLDRIEIIEPPIQELTKKPSILRRLAFLGCGGIVMLAIGFVLAIKILLGPGPQSFHTVPEDFPKEVPVYDKANIDTIDFTPGRYEARAAQLADIFPSSILKPFIKNFRGIGTDGDQRMTARNRAQKMWAFFTSPDDTFTDTYVIEWQGISTDPDFVYRYYKTELRKAGFTLTDESATTPVRYQHFTNSRGLDGAVEIERATEGGALTHLLLTVYSTPQAGGAVITSTQK